MSDDRVIEAIVRRAVAPRLPFPARFARLVRALGWTGLFGGAGARLAGAVLAAIAAAVVAVGTFPGSVTGTVAVGPLLLLLLASLVDGADRLGPLAGLRRSVLFTIAEVTAVRTVLFTAGGFLFTVTVAASTARTGGGTETAELVAAGCAATAAAGIVVIVILAHRWDRLLVVLPAVWVVVTVVPLGVWPRLWETELRAVPVAVWAVTAVAGVLVLVIWEGRALRPGGVASHAAAL